MSTQITEINTDNQVTLPFCRKWTADNKQDVLCNTTNRSPKCSRTYSEIDIKWTTDALTLNAKTL